MDQILADVLNNQNCPEISRFALHTTIQLNEISRRLAGIELALTLDGNLRRHGVSSAGNVAQLKAELMKLDIEIQQLRSIRIR